jgi:hypothetical protein
MSNPVSEPEWMTATEVAAYMRTPVETLAQWRARGRGPRFTKPVHRVLYNRADVFAFVTSGGQRGGVDSPTEGASAVSA